MPSMNAGLETLIAQFWQFALRLAAQAWGYLQPIYEQAPTSLLLGIVIGLLAAQMLRGFLVVVVVGTLVFFGLNLLGISI